MMSRIDHSKRRIKKRHYSPFLPNPTHEIILRNAGLPEQTALLSFERNGERRSLLKSDMVYHHVAQGRLADEPYLITYCGLCNSGIGLTPLVQGRQHHFMAAGMTNGMAFLRDEESESYWDHITGECFEGRLRGERMPFWPIEVTTVAGELATNGGAILLKSSDVPVPKGDRSWLRNGLRKMLQPQKEALSPKVARTMNGPFDERLPAHTLGLGVMDVAHQAKFYPVDVIPYGGQIEDRWQDRPLLITRPAATNGIPSAQWADSGTRPMQTVIRWYGFAFTYPNCAIHHSTAKNDSGWFFNQLFRKQNK
jgi:hypothetical protein